MFYILTFVLTQQGFAKRKNVCLTSHLKCIFEILQIRHISHQQTTTFL